MLDTQYICRVADYFLTLILLPFYSDFHIGVSSSILYTFLSILLS